MLKAKIVEIENIIGKANGLNCECNDTLNGDEQSTFTIYGSKNPQRLFLQCSKCDRNWEVTQCQKKKNIKKVQA